MRLFIGKQIYNILSVLQVLTFFLFLTGMVTGTILLVDVFVLHTLPNFIFKLVVELTVGGLLGTLISTILEEHIDWDIYQDGYILEI